MRALRRFGPAAGGHNQRAMLQTPVLVADLPALDRNIAAMQSLARGAGVAFRARTGAHLAPWVAQRQLDAGACGVAVSTLAEAKTFLAAGVRDVLLTNPLPRGRAAEAVALGLPGALTLVAGDRAQVDVLAAAAREAGRVVPVLVDVEVTRNRAPSPAAAVAVAGAIAAAPGLRLRGVHADDTLLRVIPDPVVRAAGHQRAMAHLDAALMLMRTVGHAPAIVSTGGTATAALAAAHPSVTEIQAGTYATMDHAHSLIGGVDFEQAAHVVTAVTALVSPTEVLVDAGAASVATVHGPPKVEGLDAHWEAVEGHGRLIGIVDHLMPGDLVRLVPFDVAATAALHGSVRSAEPDPALAGASGLVGGWAAGPWTPADHVARVRHSPSRTLRADEPVAAAPRP